jgi:hypothetical protein
MLTHHYQNGNADIRLYNDGTRIIEYEGCLNLRYPLNIDIRVSERCAFGMNKTTGKAICNFCHESATTDGADANLEDLLELLKDLPAGIELAVGANQVSLPLLDFCHTCNKMGLVVNLTVNQGLIHRYLDRINEALRLGSVSGLGISYRKGMADIPSELVAYPNTVVHVIAGIDDVDDIKDLHVRGIKKILVLGEKDFGFNMGRVDLGSPSHLKWYRKVHELFRLFDIVSFDNLALEQLNIKRFVKDWETLYQGEYSIYINAVERYYAPSSRSSDITAYNEGRPSIREYFSALFPGDKS